MLYSDTVDDTFPRPPAPSCPMHETLNLLREMFPAPLHSRLYLVGGSVRDFLRGKPRQDVDLFAELEGGELAVLRFRSVTPKSAVPVYLRHHPALGMVEVTTAKAGETLEDDLKRRDFTVNAMAMTLSGEVFDPLGGREALRDRLLVPCSDTLFTDDPLRIFRAFRFEAEGWRLSPSAETLLAARDWNPLLDRIPLERFSREMLKALAAEEPSRFFSRMAQFRAGTGILPELFRMPRVVAGPPEWHPEGDLLSHSLQALERVARLTADPTARFCTFFHDLGKLATPPEAYPRHHGHDRAGFSLAGDFCDRLRLPARMRKALMWSCRLHLVAARWPELRDGTKMKVAEEARRGGIAAFLPLMVAADKGGEQQMEGYDAALKILDLNIGQLGIDPRLMGTVHSPVTDGEGIMPLPPEKRQALVHARRVAEFRRRSRQDG